RIKPVQGRLFDSRDSEDSMPVIVINEFMARTMFPDESPIGKRVKFDLAEKERWFTIVGIVPDVIMDEDGTPDEGAYISVLQRSERFMSIVTSVLITGARRNQRNDVHRAPVEFQCRGDFLADIS
ncbi:MAG: hypothetical protein HC767_14455, partial [Akkermansiaceae bacterium]|nr:hypothetical protein [Akkermansiaceae bacterium]